MRSAIGKYIHWSTQGYLNLGGKSRTGRPYFGEFDNDYSIAHKKLDNLIKEYEAQNDNGRAQGLADGLNTFFNDKSPSQKVEVNKIIEEIKKEDFDDFLKSGIQFTVNDDGSVQYTGYDIGEVSQKKLNDLNNALKQMITLLNNRKNRYNSDSKKLPKVEDLQGLVKNAQGLLKIILDNKIVEEDIRKSAEYKTLKDYIGGKTQVAKKVLAKTFSKLAEEIYGSTFKTMLSTAMESSLVKVLNATTSEYIQNQLVNIFNGQVADVSRKGYRATSTLYNPELVYQRIQVYNKESEKNKNVSHLKEMNKINLKNLTGVKRTDGMDDWYTIQEFGGSQEKIDFSFQVKRDMGVIDVGKVSLKAYENIKQIKLVQGTPLLFLMQSIVYLDQQCTSFLNHYANLITVHNYSLKPLQWSMIPNVDEEIKKANTLLKKYMFILSLTGKNSLRRSLEENAAYFPDEPNIFAFYVKSSGEFFAISISKMITKLYENVDNFSFDGFPPTGTLFENNSASTKKMTDFVNIKRDINHNIDIGTNQTIAQRISYILMRFHQTKVTVHVQQAALKKLISNKL